MKFFAPTLLGGWKGLRARQVSRWQERHRLGWDATDGHNGGAERTVWENVLDMESFDYRAGEKDQGAIMLVLDLTQSLERVSLLVAWAWATHFNFARNILRVPCGQFEHQRCVQFEGCVAEPLQTIRASLTGSKWSCLHLPIVLQDALREVEGVSIHEAEGVRGCHSLHGRAKQ